MRLLSSKTNKAPSIFESAHIDSAREVSEVVFERRHTVVATKYKVAVALVLSIKVIPVGDNVIPSLKKQKNVLIHRKQKKITNLHLLVVWVKRCNVNIFIQAKGHDIKAQRKS